MTASNVVMSASDDVLAASDGKMPMYDIYMDVNVRVSNKSHLFVTI